MRPMSCSHALFLVALSCTSCGNDQRSSLEIDEQEKRDPHAPGAGGALGTGGGSETGGAPGSGSAPETGGAPGTGGLQATGGKPDLGGAPGTGGLGAMGGAPDEPPTFVHPEGIYRFHIDCAAGVSGDGSSWETPMTHPAEAMKFAESGDSLLLKRGQCLPEFQGQVLFDIPAEMELFIGGGYTGDDRDDVVEDEDFTVVSADFLQNDVGSPWDWQEEARRSRADNSQGLLHLGPGANVFVSGLRLHSATSYDAWSYDDSSPHAAVVVNTGALLYFRDSELAFNASGHAAALFAGRGARVFIDRSRIESNYAADHGAIVRASRAELYWEGGLGFYDNRMVRGSALQLEHSLALLFDLTFEENETSGDGAAIHASGGLGLLNIDFVRFQDNVADSGAAIAVRGARAEIVNSHFSGNQAAGYGSAVYAEDGAEVSLRESDFVDNSATASGTIFVQGSEAELFGLRLLWNEGFLSSGLVGVDSDIEVSHAIFGSNRTGGHEDRGSGCVVSDGGEFSISDTLIVGSVTGNAPTVQIHGTAHWERVGLIDNEGSLALRWADGDGVLVDSFVERQRSSSGATFALARAEMRVIGTSLYESAHSGAGEISEFSVDADSQLSVLNTAIWSSHRDGAPLARVEPGASVLFAGSCASAALDGQPPAALLTNNPFVAFDHVAPLLKDGSPCVDVGQSILVSNYQRSPARRTAVESLTLDAVEALDAGLHVESEHPIVTSFELHPRKASWNAGPYPNHCWLYVEGDYWFPHMAGTNGQVSPIQTPYEVGAEGYLVCVDRAGTRMPIALRGEVEAE